MDRLKINLHFEYVSYMNMVFKNILLRTYRQLTKIVQARSAFVNKLFKVNPHILLLIDKLILILKLKGCLRLNQNCSEDLFDIFHQFSYFPKPFTAIFLDNHSRINLNIQTQKLDDITHFL
jgi:hypothetical protein